jgi:Ca2+-binding EF-hand superfamily protein
VPVTPQQLRELLDSMDTDHSGGVDFDEFERWMARGKPHGHNAAPASKTRRSSRKGTRKSPPRRGSHAARLQRDTPGPWDSKNLVWDDEIADDEHHVGEHCAHHDAMQRSKRMPDTVQAALMRVLWEAIHSRRRTLYGVPCHDLPSFFHAADRRRNGVLSRTELSDGMVRLDVGLSKPQLDRLLLTIDTNRSGGIDFQELIRWMGQREYGQSVKGALRPATRQTTQRRKKREQPAKIETHGRGEGVRGQWH